MTKKHYAILARWAVNEGLPDDKCRSLATVLANDNPRFNVVMFLAACGVKPQPLPELRNRNAEG